METLSLFEQESIPQVTNPAQAGFLLMEEPYERAMRRITAILKDGHVVACAWSSGKDSSTLASILLDAARQLIADGFPCPPIAVLHADTGVENPEIREHAQEELQKMSQYATSNGIDLEIMLGQPKLAVSWPVRVIGGRGLPAYPDSRSDCSTDWKVQANEANLKAFYKRFLGSTWSKPVVMTGVRQDESIARDQRIAKRGEVAEGLWTNEEGRLRASPILDFTTDDVWEHLGMCTAGLRSSYSDFGETFRIYRDAGGSSCVVVADMKMAGTNKPCGARTGCWACTRVANDKSMSQMIESDPVRYARHVPLQRLRDYLSNIQYDWSMRQYVGRTIDADGYIEIGADTFSPSMLQNLLRYTLTAQIESGEEIVTLQHLIAIDARCSMYGLCPPFTALAIWKDVVERGQRYQPPMINRIRKTPVPKLGKIKVGHPSYASSQQGNVAGLRDISSEMFSESCGFGLKVLKNGEIVIDAESDDGIEVDEEGAYLFLELEADRMIEDYCHEDSTDYTWGFKTYLRYGTLEVAKGRSNQVHEILSRTQWRQENSLHGQRSAKELEARLDVKYAKQFELIPV